MNQLSIRIAPSPKHAPNYRNSDFTGAELVEAVIVCNGTTSGKPTVDLIFAVKDAAGNTTTQLAVAMTTGEILKGLAGAIQGAEQRHKPGPGKAKDHEHCGPGIKCWQAHTPCPEGGDKP